MAGRVEDAPNFPLRIDDLFRPMGALRGEHSSFFAGRTSEANKILTALQMDGSVPVVVGDRGVGKSSLASQVFNLWRGDESAIDEDQRDPRYVSDVFWIECNARIHNLSDILLRLLSKSGSELGYTFADHYSDIFDDTFQERVAASRNYSALLQREGQSISQFLDSQEGVGALRQILSGRALEPFELFNTAVGKIRDARGHDRITLFIDEFDRLADKSGIGDFIKTASTIRLVIVGVAESAQELISDHPSVERKIQEVFVSPLSESEIEEIFSIASSKVAQVRQYKSLSFSKEFIRYVCEDCAGYPYLAQLIGYHSLSQNRVLQRLQHEDVMLGEDEYVAGVEQIFASKRATGVLDVGGELKEAVGKSSRRAKILGIVSDSDGWVSVSDIIAALDSGSQKGARDHIKAIIRASVFKQSKHDKSLVRFGSPYQRLGVRILNRYREKFDKSVVENFGLN